MTSNLTEKMMGLMAILFAVFVVGSTFSIALAQIALGGSLLFFLIFVIVTRHNPFAGPLRWFYYAVGAFLAWLILAAAVGENPGRALAMLREEWLWVAIPIGVLLLQHERYRERLITAFAVAIAAVSVYGVIQHLTGLDLLHDTPLVPAEGYGWRVRGNFGGRLTFGNYYGTAAMFLLGWGLGVDKASFRTRRTLIIATAVLALIVATLSYSRGVAVGLAATVLLAGLLQGRRQFLVLLGVVVVAVVVIAVTLPGLAGRFDNVATQDIDPEYAGGRVFIWSNSAKVVAENPIFGVGTGNFKEAYAAQLDPDVPAFRIHAHAHNDFLNIAATSGLPAALLFGMIWLVVLGRCFNGWRGRLAGLAGRESCFLATLLGSAMFMVASMTEATFADEEVRQLLMFVWAVGLSAWYKGQTETSADNG
jgi:O-antigen ligase